MTVCWLVVAFDLGLITAAAVFALVNRRAHQPARRESVPIAPCTSPTHPISAGVQR